MGNMIRYENFYARDTDAYSLAGFEPQVVNRDYLKKLGVHIDPTDATMAKLEEGSRLFLDRLQARTLLPRPEAELVQVDPASIQTEIHNYTGRCPTTAFEINPVKGCNVGCQYCLVTDGVHQEPVVAFENYHLYVRRLLEEMNGDADTVTKADLDERGRLLTELAKAITGAPEHKREIEDRITDLCRHKNWHHYYYFSPKTEALQEPTLYTGIAHAILHEFIEHFERHPQSNARLFIASKAGARHLLYEYEGESVLSLLTRLKGRVQFNTSVSIMPSEFRDVLEPSAAPIEERLAAVKLCQERDIMANSALIQPIFTPYLTDEHMRSFFDALAEAGIINYKPEFLTACMQNLAMLGQWLGHFDKNMERELYEDYIMPSNADHKKQRGRTAPNRALSIENIKKMKDYTDSLGMTVSICYWVRKQLAIDQSLIPIINANGFQCLGYQSRLFNETALGASA